MQNQEHLGPIMSRREFLLKPVKTVARGIEFSVGAVLVADGASRIVQGEGIPIVESAIEASGSEVELSAPANFVTGLLEAVLAYRPGVDAAESFYKLLGFFSEENSSSSQ